MTDTSRRTPQELHREARELLRNIDAAYGLFAMAGQTLGLLCEHEDTPEIVRGRAEEARKAMRLILNDDALRVFMFKTRDVQTALGGYPEGEKDAHS